MPNLSPAAFVPPALAVALVCAPLALLAVAVDVEEGSAAASLLFLAFLVVFAVGGSTAARRAEDHALAHGAAAAVLGWAAVQAVGTAGRLLRGEDVSWAALPALALLVATIGTVGGLIGLWLQRRGRGGAARQNGR